MDTVRQLEYVAVSRATATVITDMAKEEDSPLNHEANQFSKTDHCIATYSATFLRCSCSIFPV